MNLTEARNGTARVQIVHITVGARLEQILIVLNKIRIKVGHPREVALLGTKAINIALLIAEHMEHIARNQFHRTHTRQVPAQPTQHQRRNHFRFTGPAVAIHLYGEDGTILISMEKSEPCLGTPPISFTFSLSMVSHGFFTFPK